MSRSVFLSVIIPVFNEEKNIKLLYLSLKKNLVKINKSYEIIFVDDGSTDNSKKVLEDICQKDQRISFIRHRMSLGKAAALGTGFDFAGGKLVVIMDGDLQDDPREITKFVKKALQGYDLVSGWRIKRQDHFFKVITSKIMNFWVSFISGVKLHDFYCGLKCYRKEALRKLNLYGELYRLIPILAYRKGLRITELPVEHHHRKFGQSKYGGAKRFKRALNDLAIILFVIKCPRMFLLIFNISGLILFFLGLMESIRGSLTCGIILVGLGFLFIYLVLIIKIFIKGQIWKEKCRKIYLEDRT